MEINKNLTDMVECMISLICSYGYMFAMTGFFLQLKLFVVENK